MENECNYIKREAIVEEGDDVPIVEEPEDVPIVEGTEDVPNVEGTENALVVKKETEDDIRGVTLEDIEKAIQVVEFFKQVAELNETLKVVIPQLKEAVRQYDALNYAYDGTDDPHRRITLYRNRAHTQVTLRSLSPGAEVPFIDANFLTTHEGTKWILAAGPMDGTEPGKVSTLEPFWTMIDQSSVAVIAQLCQFEEDGENVCARYYPEEVGEDMKCGEYAVKTVEELNVGTKFTEDREHISVLRVRYSYKRRAAKTVDIVRYFNWPKQHPPATKTPALEIVSFLDSYAPATALVHCSTGRGRTGTLAGLKIGLGLPNKHVKAEHAVVATLYDCRLHSIQSSLDLSYIWLALEECKMEENPPAEFPKMYHLRSYLHSKLWQHASGDPNFRLFKMEDVEKFLEVKTAQFTAEQARRELEKAPKK